jgi:hypothetical protein
MRLQSIGPMPQWSHFKKTMLLPYNNIANNLVGALVKQFGRRFLEA